MVRTPAIVVAAGILASACASPLQRTSTAPSPLEQSGRVATLLAARPVVGVAFGGGSARGIAHVGVIRWFEEHRIPIDVAAGTSMGGLIGGAFATGMDAVELDAMIASMNWDDLFGASSFAFKNVRRKADARSYPSRIEFGMRRGIVPPTSLNSGEQVELFLHRITAGYQGIATFDDLPTPFRCVAVDLVSAQDVVLDRGSLPTAMRATMSLPLIFPPVERDGRVLVDGGAMNNVPADVVRRMGADRVVAINVGELGLQESVNYSMLGVAGTTLDAMMRASTNRNITQANVIINVPLKDYGSLDWRRSADLIREGYRAADAMRDRLLPLAVSEAEYAAWRQQRQARRRPTLPTIRSFNTVGLAADDVRRLEALLPAYVGVPLDVTALERTLEPLTGLDRYQTVLWHVEKNQNGEDVLVITGRTKPYAPPFLMLGLNLENTTSSDFRITAAARYLTYGQLFSGSELRIDGMLGSDPSLGFEFYEPLGPTPLFVAPYAKVSTSTFNLIAEDQIFARYGTTNTQVGINVGVNFGARSDLRAGVYGGSNSASLQVGNPEFPEIKGSEAAFTMMWRYDSQDSPVVPSRGTYAVAHYERLFNGPDAVIGDVSVPTDQNTTQLYGAARRFWSLGDHHRLFVYGAGGTSFDTDPLPTDAFALGSPLRLGAYRFGELRGRHYWVVTTGYLRQVGRLPDFMGGPLFIGGWVENGDAFDDAEASKWRTNYSVAMVADTLIGPVFVAGSGGFSSQWRTYIGVGRIFR
jgi:NTE family protein